jgi:hypothetical protein
MKTLLIALLALSAAQAQAKCITEVPESSAQKYITEYPTPGLKVTCAEKPSEQCLCIDGITDWRAAEITVGPTKTLIVNPTKQAQLDAAAAQAKIDAESAATARKILIGQIDGAKSVDELKIVLKAVIDQVGIK